MITLKESFDLYSLLLGFILGIVGSLTVEWIRRYWSKRAKRYKAKKVLQALCEEIEQGIKRCRTLIDMAEERKLSFSRIYISLWDSARTVISEGIEDTEIIRFLHQIYYRFDLINFNMERNRFGAGAAFAKEYISEIEENYISLKNKIASSV